MTLLHGQMTKSGPINREQKSINFLPTPLKKNINSYIDNDQSNSNNHNNNNDNNDNVIIK